jgi:hypothetical protein
MKSMQKQFPFVGRTKVSQISQSIWLCSPNVLNLKLLDLPGLTEIAVEDQPADIADQIERMVLTYIEPDNAIILAITAANQGLANSDSLIADSHLDFAGKRTSAVLPKPDRIDKGIDARDVFLNKVYPLKLPYMGVVNRSQQDIIGEKLIGAASQAEKKIFTKTFCYEDIAANCGTEDSIITLNQSLMRDIKSKLPSLYDQIKNMLEAKRGELETYGSYLKLDSLEDRDLALIDEFRSKMLSIPSAKEALTGRVQNKEDMSEFRSLP